MVGYMSNIVQSFVDRITESWRESVQKILQTSEILVESEKLYINSLKIQQEDKDKRYF